MHHDLCHSCPEKPLARTSLVLCYYLAEDSIAIADAIQFVDKTKHLCHVFLTIEPPVLLK